MNELYKTELAEYNKTCELDGIITEYLLHIWQAHHSNLSDDDECECDGEYDDHEKSEDFLEAIRGTINDIKNFNFKKYPKTEYVKSVIELMKKITDGFDNFDKSDVNGSYKTIGIPITDYHTQFREFKRSFIKKYHKFEIQRIYKVRLSMPGNVMSWKIFDSEDQANEFVRKQSKFFKDFNEQDFRNMNMSEID